LNVKKGKSLEFLNAEEIKEVEKDGTKVEQSINLETGRKKITLILPEL